MPKRAHANISQSSSSSSSSGQVNKKQKSEQTGKVVVMANKSEKNLLHILDRIALILQRNSLSCTAVAIVNNKLLIADNDLASGTGEENHNLLYIQEIMEYFSELAAGSLTDNNVIKEKRKDIFTKIYNKKFAGEKAGIYNCIGNEKGKILEAVISNILDKNFADPDKNIKEEKRKVRDVTDKLTHSKQEAAGAIQLGINLCIYLARIEQYILANKNNNNQLVNALKFNKKPPLRVRYSNTGNPTTSDYNWLNNKHKPGYAILLTNTNGAHAESKIIDHLLACDILTIDKILDHEILIGIAKKCCLHCIDVINFTNQTMHDINPIEANKNRVLVSGAHYRDFDKWNEAVPFFIMANIEKAKLGAKKCRKKSGNIESNYHERNNLLAERIKATFMEKHKKFILKDAQDKYEAEKILKESDNKKLITCYIINTQPKSVYLAGYSYTEGTIIHAQLYSVPITKNNTIKPESHNKIFEQAALILQYRLEEPEIYMSQVSDVSFLDDSSLNDSFFVMNEPIQESKVQPTGKIILPTINEPLTLIQEAKLYLLEARRQLLLLKEKQPSSLIENELQEIESVIDDIKVNSHAPEKQETNSSQFGFFAIQQESKSHTCEQSAKLFSTPKKS